MPYISGTIGVPIALRNLLVSATFLIGLSACGGGSSEGGDINPPPQNQPPSASAGTDQSVNENTEVTLIGSGTDPDGTIASYSWTQTSGESVTLQNADSSSATFQAPEVMTDEQLIFELTVTDDDGASATDSVQITILNVTTANQLPTANSGESQEAQESTIVTLDGSASSDSDGSITSYIWEQINNGAPILTISNATNAIASVELPELASNVEFAFRLTVTDNDGGTSQDDVLIIGRPTPGVLVSGVSGNTATLNSAAEFSVQLISQPSFNVSIPISSSNDSEGIPEQSELTFTPINWQQAQTVVVRGTNDNVQNGEQDYQVILGSTTSSDSFYNGIDPNDVNLKGIELSISPPETLSQFIAGFEVTLKPDVTYTGNNQLSFSLTESPEGMNIDLSTGNITWIPQASDQGQSYNASVSVNDGNKFSTTSFEVTVAMPEPVNTVKSGKLLTIEDPELKLNGVIFRFEEDSTELPEIKTVRRDNVAKDPIYGEMLTEIFTANDPSSRDLEVLIPITLLDEFSDITRLAIYHYIADPHTNSKLWSPIKLNLKIEENDDKEYAVLELGALKGIFYIGLMEEAVINTPQSPAFNRPFTSATVEGITFSTGDVNCQPKRIERPSNSTFIENYRIQTCTVEGLDNTTFTVNDFGDINGPVNMWSNPSKSIEEMIVWAADSRKEFDTFGIGNFDRDITIQLEKRDKGSYGVVYSTNSVEKGNVLHITNRSTESSSTMQVTIAHEYMHHAQVKTQHDVVNGKNLMTESFNERRWISEGTAMWFEDHLYDELDDYKSFITPARIFEKGISSEDNRYNNITFWKLILNDATCSDYENNIKNIFYNNFESNDTYKIENLSNILSNSNCNFGSHLGSAKSSSLEAAIAYYNYATQFKKDLSLLDSNETNDKFVFSETTYQFNRTWFNSLLEWLDLTDDEVHKLNGVSNVPAAGAYSFKVPSISGELPEGKIAELVVESNKEVIVSVTSEDSNFIGTNTIGADSHTWFSTVNQTSYIYDANGTVPELFVTLVNPSKADSANVNVYFKIRDELDVDTIITSHATGDQVSNRVVSIVGNIPEEARDSVSKVTVTANGIATDTVMNSDGSFVADLVVTLGDNIIKAQGFSGSNPITNEEIITIQGVESQSTGRNALIPSKVVFVLRWDTNFSDIDIYSTDKNNETIWYSDQTKGPGNLDYDNTRGFGPEVVSYRATDDDIYMNGTFDVDVHYYSGSPSSNYTLDVVVNETEGGNRRSLKFESIVPLTESNSSQNRPTGSGVSRFNDILTISCSSQSICSLSGIDTSKLVQAGSASPQSIPVVNTASVEAIAKAPRSASTEHESISKAESAYTQCRAEFESSISKTGAVGWTCNKNGTKLWH